MLLNIKHQRIYMNESQGSWFNISACAHRLNAAIVQNRGNENSSARAK